MPPMQWRHYGSSVFLLGAMLSSCGGPSGQAPQFASVEDQLVAVNQELVLTLVATDPDSTQLNYDFDPPQVGLAEHATLSQLPNGAAEFRWTPLSGEVGDWYFDFKVSDGSQEDTLTVLISVKSAVGSETAPRFLRPSGMGTTLDLASSACVTVPLELIDTDSTEIALSVKESLENATLLQTEAFAGEWEWCPSEAQIASDMDRVFVTFLADDGDNPPVEHDFLVVLRRPTKPDCPGELPQITHSPKNVSSVNPLTISVDVSDSEGLKESPLLYVSPTPLSDNPDLSQLEQYSMTLTSGSANAGTWSAVVKNPVAGTSQGTSKSLFYVIVAKDDDDPSGNCDHVVTSSPFTMMVNNPGGEGGLLLCEVCDHDVQCGAASDLCIPQGAGNQGYCAESCQGGCPNGTTCSAQNVTSVNGTAAKQCLPSGGTCDADICLDDAREENDTLSQGNAGSALAPGTAQLVSCSGDVVDDEDWMKIVLTSSGTIASSLNGDGSTDLDLVLVSAQGSVITSSTGFDDEEAVSACLPAGTYYLRVYSWNAGRNQYSLSYNFTQETCGQVCEDDENEDDDTLVQARQTQLSGGAFVATTQAICPFDEDLYKVSLANSELLVVDLLFFQTDASEDLDIHLYNSAGVDLTPCDEAQPELCDFENGQDGDSDEHFEFSAPSSGCPCTFYVAVTGFGGASNLYDIEISSE